ncbi:HlyD family secretion protein [Vibrio sp. PNB22_8_1]|uniref:HlyD family secretion protein n=1 Tax=unclassified Vibrio TaxID=2614977 RepID=UPI00406A94C9
MKEGQSKVLRNILLVCTLVAVLAGGGYWYILHQEQYPSTNDAYVHANIVYISPQISGKVLRTNVEDYQYVTKGMLLVQVDPMLFQARLDEAQAAYQMAIQSNEAKNDAILAASANVRSAVAQLADAQSSYHRVKDLVGKQLLPAQQLDDERAKLSSAEQNVAAARANMAELVKSQGAKGTAAPEVKKAAAALSQATLSLSYTNIFAPFDGHLGKVSIHPGSIIAAGQALMPLVVNNTFWVEANYKETHLNRIQVGMPAQIVLDLYPDVEFSGTVKAISPASGSSFSLLPPENATGNWVKVPQRFPLLIHLEKQNPHPNKPLRVGASAEVTINTVSKPPKP